jgi:hypothetical protein
MATNTLRLLALVAGLFVVLVVATSANAATWRPGTNYFVQETDVNDLLEKHYDRAFCEGIPRFGHTGEFPYEKFVVFDCMLELNGHVCSDVRVRAVRSAKVNYFMLRPMRNGECY